MPASQEIGSDRSYQAQKQCQVALKHYQNGNLSGAVKALGTAFDLDYSLRGDARVQRFASRLVGLPPDEAVFALTNSKSREALIVRLGNRRPNKSVPLQSQSLWLIGLATIFFIVLGTIALFASGSLHLSMLNPAASQGEIELHHLSDDPDQTYLVAQPIGTNSPDGWPVLVALHGKGQTGQDMVDALGDVTRNNGIMLIAPTFTSIHDGIIVDENILNRTSDLLVGIIEEVKADGMTNVKHYAHYLGQVFLGYAEGSTLISYLAQKGMDYSDAGFTREGPIGIALVNPTAPLYDAAVYWPPPTYLLLYGDQAPQAGISRDYNSRLEKQGAAVYIEAAIGADASMTSDQVSTIASFVLAAYQPESGDLATETP